MKLCYNNLSRIQSSLISVRVCNHQMNDSVLGRGIIELTGIKEAARNDSSAAGAEARAQEHDPNAAIDYPFQVLLTFGKRKQAEMQQSPSLFSFAS